MLEQQLAKLAELGLRLDEGISLDDLTCSFPREDYEERPFDLILFVLGTDVEREPWGRRVCSRVWNFDTECIYSSGDYTQIVRRLCELSGAPDGLADIGDSVDLDAGVGWLRYKANGVERNWPLEVNDDWADMLTLSYVMDDIERGGKSFFFKDNGQAMVLFYLGQAEAAELNKISNGALKRVSLE